jgi:hypothetical protein
MINIDNQEYDFDTLSPEAKQQLLSLQFVDAELQRLNAQIAVMQTARVAYAKALKGALLTPLEQVMAQGETIRFN